MYILGIETSCDDTCISVIKSEIRNSKSETKGVIFKVLSNVISSQVKIHQKYGGVYPFLAKKEHQRNLPLVLKQAVSGGRLLKSKIKNQKSKIDVIGVTVGPGLEPCLWTGINFAKELAKKLKIPLVPVNHLEAHILANWLKPVSSNFQFSIFNFQKIFPAICLVVSGGNTQLILMKNIGRYKLLGETRDDAAGECLDKTARILGLGYPGGPAIAQLAAQWKSKINLPASAMPKALQAGNQKSKINLPRPMIYQKNYDFSFSGLKTAFLYDFQSRSSKGRKSINYRRAASFEVQQAVIDVLIYKTIKAAKDYKAKSIILGGGVVANDELRKQFKLKIVNCKLKINLLVPPKNLCADNAAMIAVTAFFHRKKATKDWPSNTTSTAPPSSEGGANIAKRVEVDILGWQKIKANANLKI